MLEAPPDERNRLGKDRRANRDGNRGDDEQEREIGREAEQSVADGGPGERQEQRRDARLAVDPASQRGGECDSGDRSRGQDSTEQKWAEARLIDEKKHQIRAGHCVREASEHIDDDKRNEEKRAVRVRGQEAPRYRGKARQPMLAGRKPPSGESPLVDQKPLPLIPEVRTVYRAAPAQDRVTAMDLATEEIAVRLVELVLEPEWPVSPAPIRRSRAS
jgi:hypothetical protein